MKKITHIFSLIICISLFLCGCLGNTVSYDDYAELESAHEECDTTINSLEEKLNDKEKNINNILNYIKSIDNTKSTSTLKFGDVWSVADYFNFSFYYDKDLDRLYYSIKAKDDSPIFFIDENTTELQNLFIGVIRSDNYFESYNAFGDGDSLFFLPDYNYSYEIILIASVNNVSYRATYKFSCEDIKI